MKEVSILTKEEQVSLRRGDTVPQTRKIRFETMTDTHKKLIPLEAEFLGYIEKYGNNKLYRRYLETHSFYQIKIIVEMDKRQLTYSTDLPAGYHCAALMLQNDKQCRHENVWNNGDVTLSEQWGADICQECGELFSTCTGGKYSNAKYCSNKCKRRAEYKRRKTKKKVDPIAQEVKELKGALETVEKILAKRPQIIEENELFFQDFQTILQQIEHEQF